MGHGQPWRHPRVPSQGTVSCSAAASPEVSFPDCFTGFHLAAAARSTFIPHVQTAADAFPGARNPSASFPSSKTHLPALLQARNLCHLLNHVYEQGEKNWINIKKITDWILGWLYLLSHFNSIKTSTLIDLTRFQHFQRAGLQCLGNRGSPPCSWGCWEDFAWVLLHCSLTVLAKEDQKK